MSFNAKILADSLSPAGVRLTTFEVTFPRPILAEFNTHRMFSRNSASSRAIPVEKMLKMVLEHPYIPTHWGKNQKGMQAEQEVDAQTAEAAERAWLHGRDQAYRAAQMLLGIGIHKQITNRLLEPFMWHTVIVTATEWSNFFNLRDNAQAHPEIQKIARMMRELYESHAPLPVTHGGWHLPLIDVTEPGIVDGTVDPWKVSVARCARVSYLTHEGKRDIQADLDLHDKLLQSGHLSPFEHVARPATENDAERMTVKWCSVECTIGEGYQRPDPRYCGWFGNLRGWVSVRKLIPNEADILGGSK